MTSTVPRTLATSLDGLRRFWTGRTVLLLSPTYTGETRTVMDELTAYGARVAGLVSATPPPPDAPLVPHVFLCAEQGLQVTPDDFDAWLEDPPPALGAWLDEADPARSWTAVGLTFHRTGALFGRSVHGWRRPEWAVWEDKTRIETLWRAVGVPSPPHVVVGADDPLVAEHVRALDGGLGVVVSLDATRHCYRGAQGVRWVRDPRDLDGVLRWARERAERIRVARFVAGRPCSTLGMVLADGVAVFDPVELVTLMDRAAGRLEFCGVSALWRPDRVRAEQMRQGAERTGAWLAEHTGFRGIFSLDGLLGPDGFVATELNPRQSSGLGTKGWPGFPLNLFQRAAQEALPAVFHLPSREVEAAFRDIGRRDPLLAVRTAHPSAPRSSGVHTARVVSQGRERTVRYACDGRTVRLLAVDPVPRNGAVAPTAAALARALGRPELVSSDELSGLGISA